jgi:hypothetical protein
VPVWQHIYAELNDPNFVLISAAQDTGGEAVAGPIFDATNPTYVQVIDEDHVISSAFNFVNVPSAAWIDEEGRIVRIDESTYATTHQFGEGDAAFVFGNEIYAPALKDWVTNGASSSYVESADKVTGKIRQYTDEQLRADAAFRLANLFRAHGQEGKVEQYWKLAQSLNPDSVNFVRQDMTLTTEGSGGESFFKLVGEFASQGKEMSRPLNLDG